MSVSTRTGRSFGWRGAKSQSIYYQWCRDGTGIFGTRHDTHCGRQYYPKTEINRVAAELAKKYHLPNDWLNGRAAMFVSPVAADNKSKVLLSTGTVTIETASAEALLAMKIRASRPRLDNFDIEFLCKHLKISAVDQAVEIFERYYREDPMQKSALPILRSIFDRGQDPGPPRKGFGKGPEK